MYYWIKLEYTSVICEYLEIRAERKPDLDVPYFAETEMWHGELASPPG